MVETVDQCVEAEASGANRLELCGPGDGGLTPSREVLVETLQKVNIPTHVMIRPRAGDFNYSEEEFEQMLTSIAEVKSTGAAGVVFGVLRQDKTLDFERM
jgi:copper homeostasis protein